VDFSYSEEQQMLQDSVQKFVHRHYSFDDRNAILASPKGYSDACWELFAELGWLTVPFREEDGGFGGLATDLMVLLEEFGKAMVVEPFVATAVLGGGLIAALGNAQQKESSLGSLMEGKLQLAAALYEADGRYNLASVATSARREGDHYVINGSKILVLNGADAAQLLVSVRTAGAARDAKGISVMQIDAETAGIHRIAYTTVDGHRAAQINFKDVRVPVANLLGTEGEALPALESVVDRATLCVSAEAVGALDMLLKKTVEYTKTRKQFGTPIATFQALQHRMADMFIECQLARSIVMMAAMKLDSDIPDAEKSRAVSAAKSRVGKAIRKVGQEAVQLHGGIGITNELDVGHLFKRVTGIETLFGNSDFHTARFARQ
jgi:alkylation response protein AidB-like acyl-CoA dehydrogenase